MTRTTTAEALKAHPKTKMAPGRLRYNGLSLKVVLKVGAPFRGNTCWEVTLDPATPAGHSPAAIIDRLSETLHVVEGLGDLPSRVYSLCGVRRNAAGQIVWGFWSEPLSDWERDCFELRKISGAE